MIVIVTSVKLHSSNKYISIYYIERNMYLDHFLQATVHVYTTELNTLDAYMQQWMALNLPPVWHTYFIPILPTTWIVMSTGVHWVQLHCKDQTPLSACSRKSFLDMWTTQEQRDHKSNKGKIKASPGPSWRYTIYVWVLPWLLRRGL